VVNAHVQQGQTIGKVGASGLATAPHLHYELRVNGVAINPRRTFAVGEGQLIASSRRAAYEAEMRRLPAQLEPPALASGAAPRARPRRLSHARARAVPLVLYPAIDSHAGRVVRASRRGLENATVHHADPIALAERYQAEGARWLHLVDLDRAFGVGDQTPLLAALVKRLAVPVQVGGGLWTLEAVEELRDIGGQRVLLGARAVAAPAILATFTEQFSADSLGVSIDAAEGRLWSRQWDEAARWSPREIAARSREAGIVTVVLTELAREGALGGADVEGA